MLRGAQSVGQDVGEVAGDDAEGEGGGDHFAVATWKDGAATAIAEGRTDDLVRRLLESLVCSLRMTESCRRKPSCSNSIGLCGDEQRPISAKERMVSKPMAGTLGAAC